ncbi:unnamed protein product, partial [Brassica oleracea]
EFPDSHIVGDQNKRGGRVKLQPMVMPQSEFDHAEKEGALYGKVMVHESVEFLLVQKPVSVAFGR